MTPEDLRANPERVFQITDEAAAVGLLLRLELLGKFEQSGLTAGRAIAAWIEDKQESHLLLALHYRGFESAEENGYAVIAFPKSQHDRASVEAHLRKLAAGSGIRYELRREG